MHRNHVGIVEHNYNHDLYGEFRDIMMYSV